MEQRSIAFICFQYNTSTLILKEMTRGTHSGGHPQVAPAQVQLQTNFCTFGFIFTEQIPNAFICIQYNISIFIFGELTQEPHEFAPFGGMEGRSCSILTSTVSLRIAWDKRHKGCFGS